MAKVIWVMCWHGHFRKLLLSAPIFSVSSNTPICRTSGSCWCCQQGPPSSSWALHGFASISPSSRHSLVISSAGWCAWQTCDCVEWVPSLHWDSSMMSWGRWRPKLSECWDWGWGETCLQAGSCPCLQSWDHLPSKLRLVWPENGSSSQEPPLVPLSCTHYRGGKSQNFGVLNRPKKGPEVFLVEGMAQEGKGMLGGVSRGQ